jgi:hypothetical protein
MTVLGGEPPIDWDDFAPHIAHPTRESIVEAIRRIYEPLSAPDLKRVIDDPKFELPYIRYHVATLAEAGMLVEFGERPAGPSVEKLYLLKWPEWA